MGNILRIVIGLAGFGVAWWALRDAARVRRRGQRVEGEVVASRQFTEPGLLGQARERWVSSVAFDDESGEAVKAGLSGQYSVGTPVRLTHVPGRTTRRRRPWDGTFLLPIAVMLLTAGLLALTLLAG